MTTATTVRKSYGNRKIYSFPEDYPTKFFKPRHAGGSHGNLARKTSNEQDVNKLLKYIDDNVVGKNNAFLGPFGRRKVVFSDYAASGRSLQFIEEYILREVLPTYGNAHLTTSVSSLQTTLFRQEAREIIRNAVNASEDDAVIFCGHGCTSALSKLITALDVGDVPPVIFAGASEHHDNLNLWTKTGAKMVRIRETKEGVLDLNDLENELRLHQNCGRQLIGCFSVASSVTGILTDDVACTLLLHQYGALAFWDYNMAAPSIAIDMNPSVQGVEEKLANKEAIYFSGHKFVGGVQTPGILIAKKSIFRRLNTCEPDGFFASHEHSDKNFELQEEGNCAAVVESIRFGLAMQLKDTVTAVCIQQRQEKINRQMLQHIRTIPELILLGNNSQNLKRISVFSIMVRHPRGTFLHHNFVCSVLNDVFGIQARAGCPCSGAYAQDLLGIDQCLADQYENIILEDRRLSSLNLGVENSTFELLRPGFTRISLPYFISDAELAFIMEAVKMVATEAWKLLPQYVVDLETAEWRHTNGAQRDRKWLSSIRYVDGKMTMNERRISGPGLFPQSYSECLQTARNLFNRARKTANRIPYEDQGIQFDARGEKLRWFMLQHEAQSLLTSNAQNVKQRVPFVPGSHSNGRPRCERSATSENINVPQQSAAIPSSRQSAGSPRHYSLPSIDDPNILTCSSPVPYFLQDVNGLYYPQLAPSTTVNFAVGGTVNSANIHQLQQPQFARDRCFSLGHPSVSPPVLSPSTRLSLGMTGLVRQRNLSYNSQTEMQSLEYDNNPSPTHSLNFPSNGSMDMIHAVGRASPAPDLQTYVTEMTKELATNIKSEIREVISKVEDVLENTDNIDSSYFCERHGSSSEDGRSSSISANEVAEYLEKISIEMANEVKSEIRDVVSAVDVFITPDCNQLTYNQSIAGSTDCHSTPVCTHEESYTPGSSTDTVKNLVNNTEDRRESSVKTEDNTGKSNESRKDKSKALSTSTVVSLSSQDSGINMSFHEHDHHLHNNQSSEQKGRSSSDSKEHRNSVSDVRFSTLQQPKAHIQREFSDDAGVLKKLAKRMTPEESLWNPMVEAIDEYKMIKDGDKVMVCLSGGKDSLGLLHTLLQYQNHAKDHGVLFSIGAVTVDPDWSGCDPCVLIPHLKTLGVHYIIDDKKSDPGTALEKRNEARENLYSFGTSTLRHRLYSAAKSSGYNVLAIGQHLDDLCESFMLSVFHLGKMKTMKAHYYVRDPDLRVIRPLVYVREKSLRQLSNNQNFPVSTGPSSPNMSKERQRIKQLLTQQEILFPNLFRNLRASLHPLIGFDIRECELNYKRRLAKSQVTKEISSDDETDEEPVET